MYTGQNTMRYPAKWALNASAYDNVANDQVDWAALAQQWIQMKETAPSEILPVAPPPPPNITNITIRPPPAPAWNNSTWTYPGQTWPAANANNWNWNSSVNVSAPPPPIISNIEATPKQDSLPILPTPTFNTFAQQNIPAYPVVQPPKEYWTVPEFNNKEKSVYKDQGDYMQPQGFSDAGITLDAAKRKQLPAWIRQGLEKMEREKQKQMEKQQDQEQRRIMLEQKRIAEEQALKELEREGSGARMKSKFDSESEEEDINGRVMYEDEIEEVSKPKNNVKIENPPLLKPYRTKEERLQDVMLCVRQTLTEILLDVTNDEILAISRETINRYKNSAQTLRKTNALTSLTGGLGLSMYGESSGSESDNSDDERSFGVNKDNNKDSDLELERIIHQRRSEFEKTSREIEANLQADEDTTKKGGRANNRHQKEPDRAVETDYKSGRGDGEKCYKLPDDKKSSKSSLANNQLNMMYRIKNDVPKPERDHHANDKKSDNRKKSKYEKNQTSSESGTDSDTDSESNTSKSDTTDSTLSSKPSSHEKRSNLCKKKSQKSTSPEREHRKRRNDKDYKNKNRKKYDDKVDNGSGSKDSKPYDRTKRSDRNEKKKSDCDRSRSHSVHRSSISQERRHQSKSRENKRRSKSRERRQRSRSGESSYSRVSKRRSRSVERRHRSTTKDSHHRSKSRSQSRDRRRRSRSRKREGSYSWTKRNRSREAKRRSRSRSSRRSRSRSRGKRSHRR